MVCIEYVTARNKNPLSATAERIDQHPPARCPDDTLQTSRGKSSMTQNPRLRLHCIDASLSAAVVIFHKTVKASLLRIKRRNIVCAGCFDSESLTALHA
jgi:hypothetical protein